MMVTEIRFSRGLMRYRFSLFSVHYRFGSQRFILRIRLQTFTAPAEAGAQIQHNRAATTGAAARRERRPVALLEAPVEGLIKLFSNGRVVHEAKSDKLSFAIDGPGVYRAEVWLELDGEMRPWIYSNAIRVAPGG